MPLVAPNLDDRTFDDLLAEAQALIPRYCPDWTDFNDSEPGTTLVQLFAWFTEQMVYRINQVPGRNYIKFLQLLNLELRAAIPATTYVCFTLRQPASVTTVPIRSSFEVSGGTGGSTLYFETTTGIDLVPYPLDTIQVQDGLQVDDNSAANESGNDLNPFPPLGWSPQIGNALYLGFLPSQSEVDPTTKIQTKGPIFPTQIVIRVFPPPPPPVSTPGVVSGPTQTSAQQIVWEYQSSSDLTAGQSPADLDRWRPLVTFSDGSLALTVEGSIVIAGPGQDMLATPGPRQTADGGPRYWIRGRLAQGQYPASSITELSFVRVNAVQVENLATYSDEVLGESDGFTSQYTLRNAPVDPTSIVLQIQPVTGASQIWTPVDDFFSSGPDSQVYTVDATAGQINFGNGQSGMIPPPGALVVVLSYRSGGGSDGNVARGAISSAPLGVANVDTVTNPRAATGGMDEEQLDQLIARAPLALRGDGRAVTKEDYIRIVAEQIPDAAQSTALELWNPAYRDFKLPGCVTVVVVPTQYSPAAPGQPLKPQPTQDLLNRTYQALDAVRTVATEIFVTGPKYKTIAIVATVTAANGATDDQAINGVEQAILSYLSPVPPLPTDPSDDSSQAASPPPPEPQFPLGWPFGQTFFPSQLYDVILTALDPTGLIQLVESVESLTLQVDGVTVDIGTPVTFVNDELPAATVTVNIQPSTGGD